MFRIFILMTGILFFAGLNNLSGQRHIVTGTVTHSSGNIPIFQLSVVEQQSGTGTITNEAGNYSLLLHSGKVRLVFSEINYEPVQIEFTLSKDTLIDVAMIQSMQDKFRLFRRDQSAMLQSGTVSKPSAR